MTDRSGFQHDFLSILPAFTGRLHHYVVFSLKGSKVCVTASHRTACKRALILFGRTHPQDRGIYIIPEFEGVVLRRLVWLPCDDPLVNSPGLFEAHMDRGC